MKNLELGDVCYKAGSYFERTEKVIVTENNQKVISNFWNKLYFANKKDALKIEWKDREFYNNYHVNW